MGRRAARKVDPSLDLSFHWRSLEALPCPLSPDTLFSHTAPVELEIGSGKGLFLARASEQCPQRHFLGIELARRYAHLAAARLARLERRNAIVLHGDATRLVAVYLPASSLAAVHIYFPDPWWKKRHLKRRLMQPSFVGHLQRVLQPGARLHFWTDVAEYFQETCRLLQDHTALTGPLDVAEQPAIHDLDYRTHFERRMRLHAQAVYRAEFVKKE